MENNKLYAMDYMLYKDGNTYDTFNIKFSNYTVNIITNIGNNTLEIYIEDKTFKLEHEGEYFNEKETSFSSVLDKIFNSSMKIYIWDSTL